MKNVDVKKAHVHIFIRTHTRIYAAVGMTDLVDTWRTDKTERTLCLVDQVTFLVSCYSFNTSSSCPPSRLGIRVCNNCRILYTCCCLNEIIQSTMVLYMKIRVFRLKAKQLCLKGKKKEMFGLK